MKATFIARTLTIVCIAVTSSSVFAFGQTGHRVTGKIAENYLSEDAKAAVKTILGTTTLAEASTYPDEMRSNPDKFWQEVAGPYHYVTVPKGKRYADVGAPKKGDSVTALTYFSKVLKNPDASAQDKFTALSFIVHIIGDLHQPLHAGNGTDRGGNDVKVEFFWEPSNLHRVWDSGLIDRQQLSYTEWATWLNNKITPKDLQQWQTSDPLVWIEESAKIRDSIYPETERLSWDYNYQHLPTVKRRLQQAGIRIATYLNELF